ncbi:GNAT family N-acetyltransferase [Pseudactinotalea terrae]|uniref:GNAT family N-acetyltransferase n=1 Tax=Pseudactinotalea terrae TaxID=1743262 RepID=UPI001391B11A|nr:GNAT family N-acetyltransferase [Pseudactinotalea terrae]
MSAPQPYHHVRPIAAVDLPAVAELLGRGMADNPIHVAAYRGDESSGARRHSRLMHTLLRASRSLQLEGVDRDGALAGVAGWAPPGTCRPVLGAQLRLMARGVTFGPRTAGRLLTWTTAWAKHDLDAPHVHLGPVSVDRHLRGLGIGSLLLSRHVSRLDVAGAVGYLETDRPEAVGFYERFGFRVVERADVLGTTCWFMRRPAS